MLKTAVHTAIEQIRAGFPDARIDVTEDGEGGAYVVLESVSLANAYDPPSTWIGFRITFQYPHADVYPHFVASDLRRRDGKPLGDGTGAGHTFLGRPSIQISRRSNRLDPTIDTALTKLNKVLLWLNTRQ